MEMSPELWENHQKITQASSLASAGSGPEKPLPPGVSVSATSTEDPDGADASGRTRDFPYYL